MVAPVEQADAPLSSPGRDVKLIECPRDAMQGLPHVIPTEKKIHYVNLLLDVGFHTVDCGSFVSAQAVPQMADTATVIKNLDWQPGKAHLLVIVANHRGAEEACAYEQITYLGFPFSVSETFQKRNTNASIHDALRRLDTIQSLCSRHRKQVVVYLSMAFGNPYGDPWHPDIVVQWSEQLIAMGIGIISLADTVGTADAQTIDKLFRALIPAFPQVEFGAHLHSLPQEGKSKIDAAWAAGCRRFDGALGGYGGCPFATDTLIGNLATEQLLSYFNEKNIRTGIDEQRLAAAKAYAPHIFVSP